MQSLKVSLLALLLCGCNTSAQNPDNAPVITPLYSEFSGVDVEPSIYGPFLAATQAQQQSNYSDSARFFLEALNADPASRFVADRAFYQLLVSGRVDDAARLAVKMSEQPTGTEDDLVRLMFVLEAFKREDWAEVRLRLQGQINSGFGFIISPLLEAWSYGAEDNLDAARQALDGMAQNVRLAPLAQEHLAYILDFLHRDEEAAIEYAALTKSEALASLQPAVAYAYLMYRSGDKDKARDFLGQQAVRFNNHSFLLREGARIANGAKPSQAIATPRGAAGMIFFRLATEFSQGNSPQAALVYYRIATYLTPEVTNIYFMLGALLQEMGNVDAAAAALNAVPPSSPLRRVATSRRIEVLRSGGRFELAEELLRNALVENPEDQRMLIGLADLLQQREMFEESIAYYDRAITQIKKASRPDWVVYFARGISHERTGNWAKAETDLQVALSLSPDEPSVLNYLGYSWIDRGQRIDQAKSMIETAVKARPGDGFIVDSLGWVYYLTGDYPLAVKTLEDAVKLEPDDTTINEHLGDAYWRVGRKIEARFQWQHVLDGDIDEDKRTMILKKIEAGLMPERVINPERAINDEPRNGTS